jgi:hypothetical protein
MSIERGIISYLFFLWAVAATLVTAEHLGTPDHWQVTYTSRSDRPLN